MRGDYNLHVTKMGIDKISCCVVKLKKRDWKLNIKLVAT